MIVRVGVALAMTLALAGCRSDLAQMKLGGPAYGSAAGKVLTSRMMVLGAS